MSPKPRDYQEMSNKIGGSFRLTSLIQKRTRELIGDGRARLANTDNTVIEATLMEVEQGQIRLRQSPENEGEDENVAVDGIEEQRDGV